MQQLGAVVWQADARTLQATFANRAAETVLGFPLDQWLNEPDFLIGHVHPEDRATTAEACRAVAADRIGRRVEHRFLTAGGDTLWFHTQLSCVDGDLLGVMVDISDCKRREAALVRTDERLRTILAHAPVILFELDLLGVITFSDGRGMVPLGFRSGDNVGKSVFELFASVPAVVANVRRALAGESFVSTYEILGRWLETWYWPQVDPQGAIAGVAGVSLDVTERHAAEQVAEQNAWFLDSIVENIPDMIFVKEAEGLRFVRFNSAGEALLGHRREDLIGKNDYDFFPREQADFFVAKDREVLAGGDVVRIAEEPVQTQRGLRYLDTKKIPILDKEGKPAYLLGISRDISEFKRAQEELGALYEQLHRLDQLKTQFFANISHELRTPLTLVLGLTDRLLGDRTLDETHRSDLEAVKRNARLLLKHVNDILDISKLEAGKMKADFVAIDLAHLVRLAASPFDVLADEHRVRYDVQTPATVPAQVDPEKVQRILANLLSNAFKFTPDSGRISCRLMVQGDQAVLTVSDSGPGIPAAYREAIFERFVQVEGGSSRRFGGTGLGLSIAQELAALQGGTIVVGDAPEGGAMFTVTLPLMAPAGAEVRQAVISTESPVLLTLDDEVSKQAIETLRARVHDLSATLPASRPLVLIVEDNPEMNRFIAEIFGHEYRIATAFDGQEGLDMAMALHPDLILTDIMMPRLSGDQLVRAIRARPALDTVPIVLLTAKADDELRVRLLREGAQDYVAKPFLADELLARVGNLITVKRARDILQQELASQVQDLESLAYDLAHRKREVQLALDSMRVAREQAERASQLKTNFLRLVSHEIRTPLTVLKLHLQVLSKGDGTPLTPKQQTNVQKMASAGDRLLGLINTLLEYARIESGKLQVQAAPFELTAVAGEVCDELRPQAEEKGLAIHLISPDDLPALSSDPRLVRLILVNLVGNAVKFTDSGQVTVTLAAADGRHQLVVGDTGPGIPADRLAHIFEPFEQVEPLIHKHHSGFGLGLTLVKEMVDALGGRIEVTSVVDGGSTFTVTLPPVESHAEVAELASPPVGG